MNYRAVLGVLPDATPSELLSPHLARVRARRPDGSTDGSSLSPE